MKKNTRNIRSIVWFLAVFVLCVAVGDAQAFTCGTDTVSYGGKNYQTVQIGTQCWFKENLNAGTMLANVSTMPSDPAPTVNDPNTVQKWCYNNDTNICNTDGGFYTWAEVNGLPSSCNTSSCAIPDQNQGICPTGWHIPSDTEFKNLEMYLGMTQAQADATGLRGTDQGSKLSMFTLNGNNSSGFTTLLSGYRTASASFGSRNSVTHFWVASEGSASTAWLRYLDLNNSTILRVAGDKRSGLNIRCIKNLVTSPIVATSTPSPITPTTAQANANITDIGSDDPERTIEWGTVSGTYPNSCSAGIGATGPYSCALTSLTPDTTYYYRAKATNSAGTTYGDEVSFTTLPNTVTVSDPDETKMNSTLSNNYISLTSGTITATPEVTINTNLKIQDTIFNIPFPPAPQITNTD
ncbi:MAG: TIR protein, partial [uncultured bacterium]